MSKISFYPDSIPRLITDYTGDYKMPDYDDKAGLKAMAERLKTTAEDLQLTLWTEVGKLGNHIRRFALETEVGQFEITDEATQRKVSVKVTKYIGASLIENYRAWVDEGPFTTLLGSIELEILTRLASGNLWSPLWSRYGRGDGDPRFEYAIGSSGTVCIHELTVYNDDRFIGSELMQLAAEVGLQFEFGIKILTKSTSYTSPALFRQLHMTSGTEVGDARIDAECALAKQESRIPIFGNTEMELDPAAAEIYRARIIQKPILNGPRASEVTASIGFWCPPGVVRMIVDYARADDALHSIELRQAWFSQRSYG